MRPASTPRFQSRRTAIFSALVCSVLGASTFASTAMAQQTGNFPPPPPPEQSQSYPPQQAPVAPPNSVSSDSLAWVPPGMATLAQQASWHTDLTFDRSMLALAGDLSTLDAPARASLARLNGIAVHSYRFAAPGAYDPGLLASVRAQYSALGWKHVATQSGPGETGYSSGQTDFWINTHGINVAGAAILLQSPTSVNLIAVSGDISTLDLLHLRGHFGIPRFPDDALPH